MPHLLVERLRSAPQLCVCKHREKANPEQPSGSVDCVVEMVETLGGSIFLLGSVCFLPTYSSDVNTFLLGCQLFIVGGFVYFGLSAFTLLEAMRVKGWGIEAFEHVNYLVGSLLFLAGTVLYWPEELQHRHIEWMKGLSLGIYFNLFSPEFEGTLLFIVGSLLFAMAALVNALNSKAFSMAFSMGAHSTGSRLLLSSTALYMSGSLLFVIGSVAWLPGLGWGKRAEAIGAYLFVVGSAMYVVGGLLSILRIAGYIGGGETAVGSADPARLSEATPLVLAAQAQRVLRSPSPALAKRIPVP